MIRVIVADDDVVTSHLVCAILRKNGYTPEPAADVAALFAACARPPIPHAILLDLSMPGGSGADSVRHIKGTEALAGVPLIVVSGSDADADRVEVLRLGAVEFLRKPIDPERLLSALERAVNAGDSG
jgi:DNA-binding response OmpR family regulator